MSPWLPLGTPHPTPSAGHTSAITSTPDGPLMVQIGERDLVVWRWDGTNWAIERRVLPREDGYPRQHGHVVWHPFAYFDEESRVPVVGYADDSGTVTLQALDGSAARVFPNSEIAGGEVTALFDPVTRKPMLHGSYATVLLDGDKATVVSNSLYLGTAVADPAGARVIAVDGERNTYAWTGDSWQDLGSSLASAYSGISTPAYCPSRQRVVCAVPGDDNASMDVRALEGDRWVSVLRVPVCRDSSLLVADRDGGALILFGGRGEDHMFVAETWRSDGGEFQRVEAPLELPRGDLMAPVHLDGRLAIVDRIDLSARFLGKDRWDAEAREASPDVATLLGGDSNFTADGDNLWLLDGMGVLWRGSGREPFRRLAEGGPGARPSGQAAMAYDQVNGRLVLVGGDRRAGGVRRASRRDDTWAFTGGIWQRLETQGTPPRGPGAAVATPMGVYLFVLDELWLLRDSHWTCVASGPTDLSGERTLCFDARRGALLAAAEGALWTVAGDEIVHVADLPAADVVALDPSLDRLVTLNSGGQHFELPLDAVDLSEASLPTAAIEPWIRHRQQLMTPPAFAPPLDLRVWTELRRDQAEQSRARLGPDQADQFVRSEVRLSHGPSTGGRTRLGGVPLLDPGTRWPTWNGRPLSLLAVVDCAEVTAFGAVDLPRTGHLNFFYDFLNFRDDVVQGEPGFDIFDGLAHTRTDGWRVVHSSADATEAEPPDEALHFPERPMTCTHTAFTIGYAADAGYLPADEFQSIDDFEDYPFDDADEDEFESGGPVLEPPPGTQNRLNALTTAWEDLPSVGPRPGDEPLHKIGGFPDWIQGPLWYATQMASNGVRLDSGEPDPHAAEPRAAEVLPATPEWRLLLQLDTDSELDWGWGDGGRLYFLVRDGELQKGDFGHVWLAADCH